MIRRRPHTPYRPPAKDGTPPDRSVCRACGIFPALTAAFAGILYFPAPAAAAEAPGLTDILFEHILNGHHLEFLPGTAPLPLPAPLSVHLAMLLLSAFLIIFLFLRAFRRPERKLKGIAVLLEGAVLFVRDEIVFPVMGPERGRRWLPFFTTQFLFIAVANYLGLIPFFKTATGNINVTTAMAMMVMAMIFVIGIKNLGVARFFKNMYPPDTALPIGIFVFVLELVGYVVKSVVLSLRLFANMFAGHMAILIFLMLIFVIHPAAAAVSVPFALFIYLLEILIALIQAVVFTLLSCIFITLTSTTHEQPV